MKTNAWQRTDGELAKMLAKDASINITVEKHKPN